MNNIFEVILPNYSEENLSNNDYITNKLVCISCLDNDGPFINFVSCSHTEFLKEFITMGIIKLYICNTCHNMLLKIEAFKKQAYESFMQLKNQEHKLVKKINKLSLTPVTVISNDNEDGRLDDGDSFFHESITSKDIPQIKSQIKDEEESDLDYETPLSLLSLLQRPRKQITCKRSKIKKVKKKQKVPTMNAKYWGKIKCVILTKQEFEEERSAELSKDSYKKAPFKCEYCMKTFDFLATLKLHNEKFHTMIKGAHVCEICKNVIKKKYAYDEHVRRHFKRYECMVCNKRGTEINSMAQHYNKQHSHLDPIETQFSCKDCDFTTNNYRRYRYHREKHKDLQQCNICGATFVSVQSYKIHMYNIHLERANHKCTECTRSFKCKSGLLNHIQTCHRTEKWYCQACNKDYISEKGLKQHLLYHSKHVREETWKFICDYCNKKFTKKIELRVHIDFAHLNINHKCIQCNKPFKTEFSLKRHIKFVHNKVKLPRNKICDYCGQAFQSTTILECHIRTHTGERPLRCPYCDASFAHKAALYNHKKLLHKSITVQ